MDKKEKKSSVLVGDSAWNNARVDFEAGSKGPQGHGFIGWALALGIALAMLIAAYAVINRDRELLGQIWEMSKYLISSIVVGRVIANVRG